MTSSIRSSKFLICFNIQLSYLNYREFLLVFFLFKEFNFSYHIIHVTYLFTWIKYINKLSVLDVQLLLQSQAFLLIFVVKISVTKLRPSHGFIHIFKQLIFLITRFIKIWHKNWFKKLLLLVNTFIR